jgi:hypothetical protein
VPSIFTVTDLGDAGIGSDGSGDLRYAITTSNANDDPSNQIVFDPALSGAITLTQGPVTISKDLEIDGPGPDLLTVSGNRQGGVFNISADPGVQAVMMSGLTIADGTGIPAGGQRQGGGVYNDHANLTLTNCTVSGNTVGDTGYGGGIYLNQGSVTLNACTISGNAGGRGGGIYSFLGTVQVSASVVADNTLGGGIVCAAIVGVGALRVDSSTIADNQSGDWGAGIRSGVQTTITNSTISGNASNPFGGLGGGIQLTGGLDQPITTIRNSAIVGNSAAAAGGLLNLGGTVLLDHTTISGNAGGGIENQGSMTITDCTIADNGPSTQYASAGILNIGALTMTGSTVSGNAGTFLGGGLYMDYGTADVSNCTFSGNTAARAGGGIGVTGLASLELTSVTITGNAAQGTDPLYHGGGGLFFDPPDGNEYALLHNTLIAGNTTATDAPDVSGNVISLGYNLVGAADGSQGWRSNDIRGTASSPIDPMLGPLQDNGGPTLTRAVLAGSPAILHGDLTLADTTDQRGTARIHEGIDAPVDIGAFDATTIQGLRLDAPAEVVAGQPFTITVTALDPQGNTASTFTGFIRFSSSDHMAMLPPNYHFVASDGGVATFTVTLRTAGAEQLQVDTVGTPDWRGSVTVQVDSPPAPRGRAAAALDVFFSSADLADLGLPSPLPGRRSAWGTTR